MENNLTDKALFFAHYLKQEIFMMPDWEHFNDKRQMPVDPVYLIRGSYNLKAGYLVLTPLQAITDEDAVEVARIGCFIEVDIISFYESEDGLTWTIKFKNKNSHTEPTPSFVLDYLRSRSYALPFMGVSVETLVQWKWIKLKEG